MYQYFFNVNKYRSKEAKHKTGHPGVSKVNASSVCYVTLPDADGRTDEHEGLNSYVDSLESGIMLLWVKNAFFKISSQNLLLK